MQEATGLQYWQGEPKVSQSATELLLGTSDASMTTKDGQRDHVAQDEASSITSDDVKEDIESLNPSSSTQFGIKSPIVWAGLVAVGLVFLSSRGGESVENFTKFIDPTYAL